MKNQIYIFKGKMWKYKGPSGWHFVTLPKTLAQKIRRIHSLSEEGWGRLPATACIQETKWDTAIWYDSKAKSYLLPIKAIVRRTQKLETGKNIHVKLIIQKENFKTSLFRMVHSR